MIVNFEFPRTTNKKHRISVIDGPNVSNLGNRSRRMYGPIMSAESLHEFVREWGENLGVSIDIFMSNYEGAILEYIHDVASQLDGIIINPAGLTTQSAGVPQALFDTKLPVVEVHFTNISAGASSPRGPVYGAGESKFTPLATGNCMGLREYSYVAALTGLVLSLDNELHATPGETEPALPTR